MNVIVNWSKKPEGATHYCADWHCESTDGIQYYKYANGQWSYWGEGFEANQWVESQSPCKPVTPVPIEKQVAHWTGEGLPPVGTVCECMIVGGSDIWERCDIIAHKDNQAICWVDCNRITASTGTRIRPIRTPEQIAAEERDKAINDMKTAFDSVSDELIPTSNKYLEILFGAIHDAGYRKEVKS